jgi:glycosyltransferase involved in cell wall biosynthesis
MAVMKIVCLLPVRNGASDLPGYFSSVARFADAVVALDDGSSDETRAMLEREPLVARLLTNPVRADYRDWNDSANRNRLLEAAAALDPEWIISLDADERIDDGDALALRAFLETDALPGLAYSFRWYTMVGDLEHALPEPIWVHRLFAYAPGQQFSSRELHFAPIPTSIPRRAYLRTTFRIQHLAGLSNERRLARYNKYREADPNIRFAYDYSAILDVPHSDELIRWQARDPSTPSLFVGAPVEAIGGSTPTRGDSWTHDISIAVIDEGTQAGVRRALASAFQPGNVSVDVLFVTAGPTVSEMPEAVRVVFVDAGSSPEERRSAAFAAARGRYLLMVDGDIALANGALDRIVAGHERGFASVTGIVLNRANDPVPTTVYHRRFARLRNDLPESVIERAPPWASRARDALVSWTGDEIATGRKLLDSDYVTLRLAEPLLEFYGESLRSPRSGLIWAFQRGKAEGRFQFEHRRVGSGLVPNLRRTKRLRTKRHAANPRAVRILTVVESFGRWLELLRPQRGKALQLFGRTRGLLLAVVTHPTAEAEIAIINFDFIRPALKIVHLPAGLHVATVDGEGVRLDSALAVDGHCPSLFTAQDAIGRHLDLQIDEVLWIDAAILGRRVESIKRRRCLRRSDVVAIVLAARAGETIRTTFPIRFAVLALSRLRRLGVAELGVLCPFSAGESMDEETIRLVRRFLAAETNRPNARRTAL